LGKINNPPLISIIVPIYNVEKFLKTCLESVVTQPFFDYELILVNDGSTDNCAEICDEYAAKFEFVNVIHKNNGGVASARNEGISAATGKYLLFIDPDDFIGENSLSNLAKTLEIDGETDMVILNVAFYYEGRQPIYFDNLINKSKLFKQNPLDAAKFLASLSNFSSSVCLKLIKREIIAHDNLTFSSLHCFEDSDFTMELYLRAKTYNYCDSYVYYYRKNREGSLTYSFSDKKYRDLLHVISKWVDFASANPGEFSSVIYNFFAYQYCMLVAGFNKLSRAQRKAQKSDSLKYSWILKKSSDKRVKLVRIFLCIFGLSFTSISLGFQEKFRK